MPWSGVVSGLGTLRGRMTSTRVRQKSRGLRSVRFRFSLSSIPSSFPTPLADFVFGGNCAARATGPSLGTVIAASFFVAIFSTLATLLHSLRRLVQSSHLPSILRPFLVTWLAPLLASLASYAAFFNAYSLSYAGMTGEGFWTASRETAELFRANRARNIRDSEFFRGDCGFAI